MEHENVNIYLIAKEARVSIATISRYFNKEEQVKRSTREKIRNHPDKTTKDQCQGSYQSSHRLSYQNRPFK